MVVGKLWDNSYTRLFLVDGEDTFYLHCVGITEVYWTRTAELMCVYCGQEVKGFICPNCGSTRKTNELSELDKLGTYLGRASVGLVGILPHFRPSDFVDGIGLDVMYGRALRPGVYVPKDVIFRFRDCVMDTMEISDLVILEPEDCGLLRTHLKLVADVTMIQENWGWS